MSVLGAFAMPHPPLIIPAVGHGRERGIQATIDACEEVARRIAALEPDTLIISSPHATLYRDYFHISPGAGAKGSFGDYGAPQASYAVRYDAGLVEAIEDTCRTCGISAGTDYERDARLDHGTMIAVDFVQRYYQDFRVVRIGLSGFNAVTHYKMGMAVQEAASALGRHVVWIASGDLSHKLLEEGPYGFAPEGPQFDERITQDFAKGDLVDVLNMDSSLAERAAECGLRSFQMMVGALHKTDVQSELLSYEGPFGVGYGVAALAPVGKEGADEKCNRLQQYLDRHAAKLAACKAGEDEYVRLARASLEAYVRSGRRIDVPARTSSELTDVRAGCFVSLKIDGSLRGCIGTIEPTRASLAEEICANAISAATRDPRFRAVRTDELDQLVYDVDVLGTPEVVGSKSDLDPVRYGVIVSTTDGRRGLLLPDLDGVDTVDEQLRIAAQKGGIDLGFERVTLQRFEVVRHQ